MWVWMKDNKNPSLFLFCEPLIVSVGFSLACAYRFMDSITYKISILMYYVHCKLFEIDVGRFFWIDAFLKAEEIGI